MLTDAGARLCGRYADAVLERFSNPFLDHRLSAIALNSAAKLRVRLLPSIAAFAAEHGAPPPGLVLALAAFFAYDGPKLDGCETEPLRTDLGAEVRGLGAAVDAAVASLRELGPVGAMQRAMTSTRIQRTT